MVEVDFFFLDQNEKVNNFGDQLLSSRILFSSPVRELKHAHTGVHINNVFHISGDKCFSNF